MKRRFGLLCLLLLLTLSIAVFLSSCDPTDPDDGGSTGDPECEHVFGEWELREEATCKLQALEVRECTLCDATEERREGRFASHKYGEWLTVEEGSCISGGKLERICSVCGDHDVTFTAGGDHSLSELIPGTPATLFENGSVDHYQCSLCEGLFDSEGNKLESVSLPKLEAKLSVYLDGEAAAEFTVDNTTSG